MARLSDICLKIGSGATPTGGKSAYLMKGISLIRSQNVLDISFAEDGLAYISDEQARKLQNVEILEGDILLNITGDSVARVCIVPNHILPARVNQHVAIIRVDKTKADNNYILYSLIKSKKTLLALASAGSRRNALTKKMIEEFEVFLPSLAEQKRIASILSSLDDKIAVNRRINANLEAQAEALFKSWFVDFTPFKDQPFVDSELGPIPQGWKVGKLGDIGEIVGGSTPSKSKPEYYTTHGIAWLTPKDLSTSKAKFTSRGEIDITDEGYNSTSTKLMPRGSVLFSSRAPIGYLTIAKNEICTNQGFKSLVPNGAGTGFIYYTLRHLTPQIENRATGSTFKEASATLMRSVETIVPPTSILNKFEELLRPILQFQEKKEEENQRLAALRDTLLPKLMSGEIKL